MSVRPALIALVALAACQFNSEGAVGVAADASDAPADAGVGGPGLDAAFGHGSADASTERPDADAQPPAVVDAGTSDAAPKVAPDAAPEVPPDAATSRGQPFGAPCAEGTDCESGLCERIRGDEICTIACDDRDDCPAPHDCRSGVCDPDSDTTTSTTTDG